MKEDSFDYEGVRSENLRELIKTVMGWGMYGPYLDRLFYYAKQVQLEIDGDNRESIGALEDELKATKKELKIVNGQLTTTLNNWEAQKGKLSRERESLDERKRKLDERDARIAEDISSEQIAYWKKQAEKAREEAEKWRKAFGEILDACHEVNRIAAYMEPGLEKR